MTGHAERTSSRLTAIIWTMAALATLGLIGLTFWFGVHLREVTCSDASPYGVFFGAFQGARTAADIWETFGVEPSSCRSTILTTIDNLNRVDLYAYIPAYGLGLIGFLLASPHAGRRGILWLGLTALAAALVGDIVETSTQLSITSQIANLRDATKPAIGSQSLVLLALGNTSKTTALPFVYLTLAILWFRRSILGNALALILLLGPAMRIYGFFGPIPGSVSQFASLLRNLVMLATAASLAIIQWLESRKVRDRL